jgi:hypothetical protein
MEQTTFTPPLDVVAELPERCDQCGAAAKLHLTLADGALAFCGHHANAHAATIVGSAVRVTVLSEFSWTGAAALGTPGSTVDGQTAAARSQRAFRNSR